ncbi:ligand-binding sensor domain-containing protein, partial [Duganella callida]
MRLSIRVVAAAAVALYCRVPALAATADGTAPIIAMQHASWTAAAGAPTGINAITQTPDGWLWIGSSAGLFRFDGVRFQRAAGALAPLSSSVANLGLLPDGTLWIAYKFGGASLLKDGVMRHYRVGEHGTPAGSISRIGRDADGRLWLGGKQGLLLQGADGDWRPPAAHYAAPQVDTDDMLLDRDGVFWVRTNYAVYALPRGAASFALRRRVAGYGALAQHPDGSVWTSDLMRPGLHRLAGVGDERAWRSGDKLSAFLFDHDGALWQPDYAGVARVRAGAAPQRTGAEHGLSGLHGFAVFEDRERNIWIGTENGLDRFSHYRLRPLALPRYIAGARPLALRAAGGVWIGVPALAVN